MSDIVPAQPIKWYKVANSKEALQWPENKLLGLEAGGKEITLALVGNEIFACAHKCPHAGGILSEGYIDAIGNVVCPLHGYKFNLVNGRNVTGEGYKLKVFAVEEREAGIFVGFDESSLLSFLK